MFSWWGRAVIKVRRLILAAAVLVMAVGLGWGSGLFNVVIGGGLDDPDSESAKVAEQIVTRAHQHKTDLVVLYSSDSLNADDPAFKGPVTTTIDRLRRDPDVAGAVDYYATGAPSLVSRDRHAVYASVSLKAQDPKGKVDALERIRPRLKAPGVTTELGGPVAFDADSVKMTQEDVARGEMFAMPLVLVLLVLLYGGLVAASMPLLIGGLSIMASFTIVRLLAGVTDVSTFAISSITVLGLGMAVDYSLFMISRFREELADGHDTHAAIVRTMTTAGRTVFVSGLIIVLAQAGLVIFPQPFLRSMALGGMSAVLVAMIGALTVLPAILTMLGHRINALKVPLPRLRRRAPAGHAREGGWARLAHSVMRRPVVYLVSVLVLLGFVATPFLHVRLGAPDERVMPKGNESRVVAERITADFAGGTSAPIETLVTGSADVVSDLDARIKQLPGVTGTQVKGGNGPATLISVSYRGKPTDDLAYDVVRSIRDLPVAAGGDVRVGGRPASDVDRLDTIREMLPRMFLLMAVATMVVLFLAFGSVLLPLKAMLMNLVSIGASFGVVVWIFQDGHLADLFDFTPTGFTEPLLLLLLFAVLFGLSTDYEIFLLSRVREEWDRTGDTRTAVALGVERTGRIISAAALLLIVVTAGFATGGITFAKFNGVGMVVALAVDATLVRMLLVPASMRLLGRWSWWAPGPLGRVYRRYGLHESAPLQTAPAQIPSDMKSPR